MYTIHLPPLRERGDDLLTLVQFYVRRFSTELGRHVSEVSAKAMERLSGYDWPGNVRELQSVLKRSVLQTTGTVLLPEFLSGNLPEQATSGKGGKPSRRIDGGTLDEMERDAIQQCLTQTRGNRQQTAKQLGISTRTLLRKIRRYNLDDPQATAPPEKDDTIDK